MDKLIRSDMRFPQCVSNKLILVKFSPVTFMKLLAYTTCPKTQKKIRPI